MLDIKYFFQSKFNPTVVTGIQTDATGSEFKRSLRVLYFTLLLENSGYMENSLR